MESESTKGDCNLCARPQVEGLQIENIGVSGYLGLT